MSQQLTLSSLFSALALAALCVITSVHDIAGDPALLAPSPAAPALIGVEAAPLPGLLP